MADNSNLRGKTVIDTLVNMSSDEMRGATVTETMANILGADPADDFVSAVLAYAGASDSLRGETVVETIRNILEDAGSEDSVPYNAIDALLMLDGGAGGGTVETLVPEAAICSANNAVDTPLVETRIYGKSVQDGTPTPSVPVAIVSVEGDSEGNISLWARGKNLADPTFPRFSYAAQRGVTYTKAADGTITASGTASALAYLSFSNSTENPFGLIPGETYTISTTSTSGKIYALTPGGSSASLPYTFEYGDGGYNVGVAVRNGNTVDESFKVMLQHGSTATEYIPYMGTVTPIDLDGHELRSLPDGTRDELTIASDGTVTLTQRVGEFDLGDRTWNVYSYGQGYTYYANLTGKAPLKADGTNNIICASYALGTAGSALSDGQMVGGSNNNRVYIRDDRYATETDLKTALSGVMLYYALATPVTYDLGTIAMANVPSPDFNMWAVTDVPTTLSVKYIASRG